MNVVINHLVYYDVNLKKSVSKMPKLAAIPNAGLLLHGH